MSSGTRYVKGSSVARPTKYKQIFCKRARDFLAEGQSKTACAGLLGISKETLYEWCKTYPEFSDAINEGLALGEKAYLELLYGMSKGNKGNVAAAIFIMKSLYKFSDNGSSEDMGKPISIVFSVDKPNEE